MSEIGHKNHIFLGDTIELEIEFENDLAVTSQL